MTELPRLVRFLFGVQRRPATTMIAVNLALSIVGAVACRGESGGESDWPTVGYLAFVTCATTATAEALSQARSLWSRVVVVGLGTGATLPVALASFELAEFKNGLWVVVVGLVAAATAVPHVTVALASRFDGLRRGGWRTLFACVAAALFLAGGMTKDDVGIDVRLGLFVGWLVATQIAFHAAAASSTRLWPVLLEVVLASGACVVALHLISQHQMEQRYAVSLGVGWLLGALLVPFARLGRSFTAVPVDHPIYTDFGGQKARGRSSRVRRRNP